MVQRTKDLKKVLFISYDGMTDPLGQSQVIPYLKGLGSKGYSFTILSFEKRHRLSESGRQIEELLMDAGIKWEPMTFTTKPPVLSKIYDDWRMRRKVVELYRKEKFSFTHCRSYVPAGAGLHLFKKFGVPFLFDMRGFWVDERVDNGQWDLGKPFFKWAYQLYKKKEKKYLLGAAHIISLTRKGKKEMTENMGVPEEKISVIPCCVDLEHFNYENVGQDRIQQLRSELEISQDAKILTYLGSLGGWYLSDQMLVFFTVLKKRYPTSKFLFITKDEPTIVLSAADRFGIDPSDLIIRAASRKEVPLYLSLSNWSVFFIKDAYSKKASSPTKQGEIMAMGIPLICNDIGDTGNIVRQTGAGVVATDFSNAAYENCIDRIKEVEKISKEKIRAEAFSFFDLGKGVSLYADVYKRLQNENT